MEYLFRNRRQFLVALALSVFGVALNQLVYQFTDVQDDGAALRSPIAYAERSRGDVSRKSARSTAWRAVNQGDMIYAGDTVRTGSESSLELRFQEGGRSLSLEASSMIVLERLAKEIQLNLVDGNIFVAPDKAGSHGPALVAKSGEKKISLDGETPHVLKATDGESQVKLEASLSGSAANKVASLVAVEPRPETVIHRLNGQERTVNFRWRAVPGQVELWAGPSPGSLKKVSRLSGTQGQANAKFEDGLSYWQLRLFDGTGADIASTTPERLEIRELAAPEIVSPTDQSIVRFKADQRQLEVRWFRSPEFTKLMVRILSRDEKQVVFSKEVSDGDALTIPNLATGDYVLTLQGFLNGQEEAFSTTKSRFAIVEASLQKLAIEWDGRFPAEQEYLGGTPELRAAWRAPAGASVHSWRLLIAPEGQDLAKASPEILQKNEIGRALPAPGRYKMRVEALDENAEPLGTSAIRTVISRPVPLLPSVRLADGASSLESDATGSLKLAWEKLDRALLYRLHVSTAGGQTVLTEDLQNNEYSLEDLMPGRYVVSVTAVDRHGRAGGPFSVPLLVPDQAPLASPKLKKVRVE